MPATAWRTFFQLKVVAEGVETEEQLKLLRLLRCDEIQGFLLHKPLPEQFAALLQQPATAPASGTARGLSTLIAPSTS